VILTLDHQLTDIELDELKRQNDAVEVHQSADRMVVMSDYVDIRAGESADAVVQAPAGYRILSGGGESSNPLVFLVDSAPTGILSNGWRVRYRNTNASGSNAIRAVALCATA